jgi:hypothetical protein
MYFKGMLNMEEDISQQPRRERNVGRRQESEEGQKGKLPN